ncbi:MAG: hypothetical protein HUJ69_05165 [Lachnospiraceae bacterium]|nr:hypothetical protein [Lachnospiraceae bacterium]
MKPLYLFLLSAADITLYTLRNFTNKMFAHSYDGEPALATPVFSFITGVTGFLFTLLFSGGLEMPSLTTLLCGVSAGGVLFLYDLGNIHAAKKGPYSIQTIINIFGALLIPMLVERVFWSVKLTLLQYLGVVAILVSFVFLNLSDKKESGMQKGFMAWVFLIFLANGVYSSIVVAQQRWTGYLQKNEMIAVVFLTMSLISLVNLLTDRKTGVRQVFRLKGKCYAFALASSAALPVAMWILALLIMYVPASILYPIQNSAILVLSIVLSAIIYKEKLSKGILVGIAFAIAGICALSL